MLTSHCCSISFLNNECMCVCVFFVVTCQPISMAQLPRPANSRDGIAANLPYIGQCNGWKTLKFRFPEKGNCDRIASTESIWASLLSYWYKNVSLGLFLYLVVTVNWTKLFCVSSILTSKSHNQIHRRRRKRKKKNNTSTTTSTRNVFRIPLRLLYANWTLLHLIHIVPSIDR